PEALTAEEQAQLTQMGHALKPLKQTYGNLHAVAWDPAKGKVEAASDPRGVGAARVVPVR
ncbi:MAG: gamma-glutamyltransferase, partial [Panacagrimonas sp.]